MQEEVGFLMENNTPANTTAAHLETTDQQSHSGRIPAPAHLSMSPRDVEARWRQRFLSVGCPAGFPPLGTGLAPSKFHSTFLNESFIKHMGNTHSMPSAWRQR